MKTLKFICLSAVLLLGANAMAQKSAIEEKAQRTTDLMLSELQLTEEQTEKVSMLNHKIEYKLEAVRNNTNYSDAKKREHINGNKESYARVLESILTKEQLDKWAAIQGASATEK